MYFKGLVNVSEDRSIEITARLGLILTVFEKTDQNFTRDEVEKDSKKPKAGKSAGVDVVATVHLKTGWKACGD